MRTEDYDLLRGSARFVADLVSGRPEVLHAAFVRSSVAAAEIEIDASAARELEGVVGVWTLADLTELSPLAPLGAPEERFAAAMDVQVGALRVSAMADGRVRYVGEPVAVVVARDRYLAEDAAAYVDVDYRVRTPVLSAADALAEGAPVVNVGCTDNVGVRLGYAIGAETTESTPTITVRRQLRIGRQTAMPIECRGVLAEPRPDDGVDVWTSSQVPFVVRRAICDVTGWDSDRVRVRAPEVGGGFGQKATVYGEELVIPILARRLGAPVAWLEDRYENLIGATHARDQVLDAELRVDADGRILSWRVDYTVDLGAHNYWMVGVVANTAVHLLGPYRIPVAKVSATGFFSNKAPTAQYRGAGRPEATFALERCLDEAAKRLGIGVLKIREVNLLTARDLPRALGIPYRDGVPIVYDGKDYRRVLERAQELIPEDEVASLRAGASDGQAIGFGVAAYTEATARGPGDPESARIWLLDDGTFRVAVGVGTSGQSHRTVLGDLAAGALGVTRNEVHVTTGDTALVRQGLGSFASRVGVVAGTAVWLAAAALVRRARGLAEQRGYAVTGVGAGGLVRVDGDVVPWREVASWGGSLVVEETFAPQTVTWTMGVHLAVVGVDRVTAQVSVLRYAVAHESGPSLNERVVEGQLRGGVAQGIGMGLLEEFQYDEEGQPVTVTLADYRIPESADVPPIRLAHVHHPSALNPLGLKGVGESGVIAGPAVLASAIEDALTGIDLRLDRTPIDADELLLAVRGSRP